MKHVIEITCRTGGTTVGTLFDATIFRKSLLKTGLTVVLATAYCEMGITVGLRADLTDEACWYFFHEVLIVATITGSRHDD